ncbi:MAG: FDLD family class I lanthipeptide [Ktedonobacteraceae bacterium]|nr:FDLD family class I lanthipeptide [Ktedonobacteraceae bacterium]
MDTLFDLDIRVEPVQAQNASGTRGSNSYTTACHCATVSCIDDDCDEDERYPRHRSQRSRCPDN